MKKVNEGMRQSSPRDKENLLCASVVLCTRNRAEVLSKALRALANMKVPDGMTWECLVIDNGSTDGTRGVVEEFVAHDHSHFRYSYEPRAGKTYALNRGIAEALGEVLAFTDDDAIVAPDWISAIVTAFSQFDADGVGGRVVPIWEASRPDWLGDELLNVLAVLDFGNEAFQLDWKRGPRMLYGVNFAFRREVFSRIGNFNTTLGSRGEDQELFDRLARVNARIFYDPGIAVQHIIPGSRLTKDYYRDWYRASGLARARLEPVGERKLLGIPLYTLRQGLVTAGKWLSAVVRLDRRQAFQHWLGLLFFRSYYIGRIGTFCHQRSSGGTS